MRLLFTRFPLESAYGGAETQSLTLMKGLKERRHDVSFLGSCPILLEEAKKLQATSYKLYLGPPPVTKWNAVSFLWQQHGMRKKLQTGVTLSLSKCPPASPEYASRRPSLALGAPQHDMAVFMLSLSEKLLLTDWLTDQGVRVFWIEHDRVGPWLAHSPWLPKLRRLAKLATTAVVSDLSREIYLGLGFPSDRVVSIPNGIDLRKFTPGTPTPPLPLPPKGPSARGGGPLPLSRRGETGEGGTLRVGCLARLSHDKGVDLLIDAVSDLPDVELTIVGTGKEEEKLRTRINQSTNKSTNLLPCVPDIVDFYRSQDVIVLPSREHDPFGLVIAEAMACSVPTVVTDACGIASHLNDGESLIVKAGRSEPLREAIQELQDATIRTSLRDKGLRAARERFSSEKMVESYEKLLI